MPGTAADAARLAGVLWAAVHVTGVLDSPGGREHHLPGALDARWLASLPLPPGHARPPGQPAALLHDGEAGSGRHTDATGLAAAYASRPRTQVPEDIASEHDDQWYALTARYLTRLSGSELHATCNIFASRHGDEASGRHRDTWYGAAVQVSGVKEWTIGEALSGSARADARQVTMAAGDILLLPRYLPHMVTTPPVPGHSVHLAFAIDRDPSASAGFPVPAPAPQGR